MQLMWLHILSGKQFEDSLVNAHLATKKNKCTQCSYSFSHNKLKNAINVVIYFFGKQFEDSLENVHLATIKQMHPVQLFILSDGLFEDTFKKHCQRHNRPRVLSLKLDKSFFQPK